MMLVLVRHGLAAPVGELGATTDAERGLSSEGFARTRAMARMIARLLPNPVTILTSPLRRATETAAILAEEFPVLGPPAERSVLTLHGPTEAIVEDAALSSGRGDVVLVGHQPSLVPLASWLLTGGHDLRVDFRKAAALAVEHPGAPRRGDGTLLWFLPPRLAPRMED